MSDEPKPRCSDEQLARWANGESTPLKLAAQELITRRSRDRNDSRRATQLRKLRWAAEHILTKLDGLGVLWRDEDVADGEAKP